MDEETLVGAAIMTTQPTPTVTREDVARIVTRDFPAESAREVFAVLAEYGGDDSPRECDRVCLAALKLANGSIDRLRSAIQNAKRDYRDVLALAEYPQYSRCADPSASLSREERQRIIDADNEQYREWVAR